MAVFRNRLQTLSIRPFHVNSARLQNNPTWSLPESLVLYQKKSFDVIKTKFNAYLSWYEEFTGLRDLKEAQDRVIAATNMMKEAQDRRRHARVPLGEIQKRLQDFQPELRNMPRDDDRYMEMIKEEHLLLKQVKQLQQNLQEAENDERDAFDELTTTLRTSHEAERNQAERKKYWSIIASIIGTIIGVVGSSINNQQKMKELKALVYESTKKNEIQEVMSSLEQLNSKMLVKEDLKEIYNSLAVTVNENRSAQKGLEKIYNKLVVTLKESKNTEKELKRLNSEVTAVHQQFDDENTDVASFLGPASKLFFSTIAVLTIYNVIRG